MEENVKAELDAKVVQILGEDHPVAMAIIEDNQDLQITDVLLATFTVLLDRIEALEGRNIH